MASQASLSALLAAPIIIVLPMTYSIRIARASPPLILSLLIASTPPYYKSSSKLTMRSINGEGLGSRSPVDTTNAAANDNNPSTQLKIKSFLGAVL
jgi:hypothetical protein